MDRLITDHSGFMIYSHIHWIFPYFSGDFFWSIRGVQSHRPVHGQAFVDSKPRYTGLSTAPTPSKVAWRQPAGRSGRSGRWKLYDMVIWEPLEPLWHHDLGWTVFWLVDVGCRLNRFLVGCRFHPFGFAILSHSFTATEFGKKTGTWWIIVPTGGQPKV